MFAPSFFDQLSDRLTLAVLRGLSNLMLTQARLQELLHYDPETGEWIWLVDRTIKTKAGDLAGRPGKYKYCSIGIDGQLYRAHRLAWLYMTGSWPVEIDHVDRNGHNNRWTNLREATRSLNNANRSPRSRRAPSLKGVYKNKRVQKNPYESMITVNRKSIYLGAFGNAEEAHAAYLAAATLYFGKFATAA